MAGKLTYDLRRVNGQTIYTPNDPESVFVAHSALPDVYTSDTAQRYQLGTIFDDGSGRFFRYAQNDNSGNVLVPGRMVQQNWQNGQMTGLVPEAAIVGDTSVTLTIGTVAIVANQFRNGWLWVEGPVAASAEKGFIYQIASHPAASGSATCAFTLKRALIYAIGAARRVSVTSNFLGNIKSSSHGCKVVPANGQTFIAVGVPICRVTQAQFFWAQYKGIAPLENDGSVLMAVNTRVERGEVTDGTGQRMGDDYQQSYGTCLVASYYARMSLVALDLPELI